MAAGHGLGATRRAASRRASSAMRGAPAPGDRPTAPPCRIIGPCERRAISVDDRFERAKALFFAALASQQAGELEHAERQYRESSLDPAARPRRRRSINLAAVQLLLARPRDALASADAALAAESDSSRCAPCIARPRWHELGRAGARRWRPSERLLAIDPRPRGWRGAAAATCCARRNRLDDAAASVPRGAAPWRRRRSARLLPGASVDGDRARRRPRRGTYVQRASSTAIADDFDEHLVGRAALPGASSSWSTGSSSLGSRWLSHARSTSAAAPACAGRWCGRGSDRLDGRRPVRRACSSRARALGRLRPPGACRPGGAPAAHRRAPRPRPVGRRVHLRRRAGRRCSRACGGCIERGGAVLLLGRGSTATTTRLRAAAEPALRARRTPICVRLAAAHGFDVVAT